MGGMILFGHDRERQFPDAWIQAGRFAGSDKSRILDRIEIHSFPVQAVEEVIAFVQKHSWHG
ncbi:transcriptional regulator, partial [Synechococcus sp. BA-120 BA3]|nr:transcriptional regulator [Synechococcus sp. BA-120 BA3]